MATYQREHAHNVLEDIKPLLVKHWQEIAHYPDIQLNPDFDTYMALEAAGVLRVFTARDGDELIGYAVWVVKHNPHYADSLQAMQDVLFLLPEHRKGRVGLGLILHSEEMLKAEGVQVIYHHVKVKHDFGPMLERLGYTHIDSIYGKRLD